MSIIWKGPGGMDAIRKRCAWWRSEIVLDRRYHGHHCFDMNLGHMAVAVEQRIRLTAMVAAPLRRPSGMLRAAKRMAADGAIAGWHWCQLGSSDPPSSLQTWSGKGNCRIISMTANSFDTKYDRDSIRQTPDTDTSNSSIVVSSHYKQRGPLSPT